MDVRVNKGDSIWKIAKARKPEGVSTAEFVQQILDANDLEDPDKIKPGQVLSVPGDEPPTPRPRPIEIGPGTAETGTVKGAEAEGVIAVQPATAEEMLAIASTKEAIQRKATLESLGLELQSRFGDVNVTQNAGPPLPEAQGERFHPVAAQEQELSVGQEVLGAAGIAPSKDQSRLPEEVMLDLDVLGLTPRRPERPIPPRNPDYATLPQPRPAYVAQAAKLPSAPDRGSFTVGDPGGLIEEGNIDLGARKRVENGDGTFSTVVSKSFEMDGLEILVPTLDPDGNSMTDDQAVQRYMETGEHLGKFDTPDAATAYAVRLSERQNPMIPRDPDHYIDLGSERWRDVFVRAPAEAAAANRKRSFDAEVAKPRPARPKPVTTKRDTPQIDWMMDRVKAATQGPTFQPTRSSNATK